MRIMGNPGYSYTPWTPERCKAASEKAKAHWAAKKTGNLFHCWGCVARCVCPFADQCPKFRIADANREMTRTIATLLWDVRAETVGVREATERIVEMFAQGIETQSAETEGLGPKDESLVANGDAPKS